MTVPSKRQTRRQTFPCLPTLCCLREVTLSFRECDVCLSGDAADSSRGIRSESSPSSKPLNDSLLSKVEKILRHSVSLSVTLVGLSSPPLKFPESMRDVDKNQSIKNRDYRQSIRLTSALPMDHRIG